MTRSVSAAGYKDGTLSGGKNYVLLCRLLKKPDNCCSTTDKPPRRRDVSGSSSTAKYDHDHRRPQTAIFSTTSPGILALDRGEGTRVGDIRAGLSKHDRLARNKDGGQTTKLSTRT